MPDKEKAIPIDSCTNSGIIKDTHFGTKWPPQDQVQNPLLTTSL